MIDLIENLSKIDRFYIEIAIVDSKSVVEIRIEDRIRTKILIGRRRRFDTANLISLINTYKYVQLLSFKSNNYVPIPTL